MNPKLDSYPTRGETEIILERPDPIVFGERDKQSPLGLDPEQIDLYEKNGFLIFPAFFSPHEVKLFIEELHRIRELPELQERQEVIREPGSAVVRSIFNPHGFSSLFDRLSRDHRILDKVTQLLGSPVYIHHGRINIKSAYHGKSFPWHSDFETWHAEDGVPRCRMLTGWLMLTTNNEFNGPIYLVPGSHKRFVSCAGKTPREHHKASLRKQEYGIPSAKSIRELVEQGGLIGAYGSPGTLMFHEANIMHGSPDNISPWDRINLMFVYNSVENTPEDEPFGARNPRPEFLRNTNFTPLESVESHFQ
uniref:Ectoine hydroxylase n=1 Tax=Candidatus Kentrum sp. LFY TaxID=2126342 RepID=A0A450WHC0_9GAMM|nr:MAG: ectoine hydroxylase [Candidatus Kentron sp. LFY]